MVTRSPRPTIDPFIYSPLMLLRVWTFSALTKYSGEKIDKNTDISAKYSAENETETLKHCFHDILIIFKPVVVGREARKLWSISVPATFIKIQ